MHGTDGTVLFDFPDEAATRAFGESLGPRLEPGSVVWLQGDLGAGKTTLVRALLHGLHYEGAVKSPTYSLVEVYVISSLYLYHFDFYRFESPEEFLDAGMDEYFHEASIALVEWPERASGCVPGPDLQLHLRPRGEGRRLEVAATTSKGGACLRKLLSLPCVDALRVRPERPSSWP